MNTEEKPMEKMTPIYTIGYGGRSTEEFIRLLKQFGIEFLLDVRSKPYSSFRPEFSKDQLERLLASEGIKYLWLGDSLGGQPDDPECYTSDGRVDYLRVSNTATYKSGLERLDRAWKSQKPVAMMCSEGKPENCHRSKLIGESLLEANIPVMHIDEMGILRSQVEVIRRLTKGQLPLFGDSDFGYSSRKKYPAKADEPDDESK